MARQSEQVVDIRGCTWAYEYAAEIEQRMDAAGAIWPERQRVYRLLNDGFVQREHQFGAEIHIRFEWRTPDVAGKIEALMAQIETPATGIRKAWRAVWKLWPFRGSREVRPTQA